MQCGPTGWASDESADLARRGRPSWVAFRARQVELPRLLVRSPQGKSILASFQWT